MRGVKAAALALILAAAPLLAADKPHIVLILADDMGYGDVSAYNPESKIATRRIDSLAREGIRFTDAHSPASVCVPTRYGLMTGRYPMRAELPWRERALIEPERPTLPGMLRTAGYRTAMVGKWHLGFDGGHEGPRDFSDLRGGPLDRGFDSYFGIPASLDQTPYYFIRGRAAEAAPTGQVEASESAGWSPIQGAFWRAGGIAPGYRHIDVLPRFAEEAEKVIGSHAARAADEPLFLYLAMTAPHTPWLPLPAFQGKSGAGLYGDFALQVDATVGRVLDALEKAGMSKDTLVLFTSDNGPVWYPADDQRFGHRATGPLRGMKGDSWEAAHRVPFVARWPGRIPPGAVSEETICFTDLFATFAALAGAAVPTNGAEDSFDVSKALLGQRSALPARAATVYKDSGDVIRMGDWKLIAHLGSGGFSEPRSERPERGGATGQLYNLRDDLGETTNRWLERPEVVRRLVAELERIKRAGRSR